MKKFITFCLIATIGVFFTMTVYAGDQATPQEVIQKVKEAADYLSKKGEAGLADFNKKGTKWVWKDTYIFVYCCKKGTVAAHPIKPKLVGKNLMGLKDIKGNMLFVRLCEAAKNPKGGWVEYWWPKPGEKKPSRKISYILQVPGQPYQVAAGIYNDKITVDELNKMLK